MAEQAGVVYAECIGGPLDGDQRRCVHGGDAWCSWFREGAWGGSKYVLDKEALEYRWTPVDDEEATHG